MTEFTSYPSGTPNWIDLATGDVASAADFYRNLFDWTTEEVPFTDDLTYTMCLLRGRPVAAIYPLDPGMVAAGVPAHWATCIATADIDEALMHVEKSGGMPMGPMLESPLACRAAVQDAVGAFFALWQPGTLHGSAFANEPGAFTWNELQTHDIGRATEFYRDVFDWAVEESAMPDESIYYSFLLAGNLIGGMMEIRPEWGPVPPNWGVYFNVANCDAAVAMVEELGGSIEVPTTEIGEGGMFALAKDPSGAYFYVVSGM